LTKFFIFFIFISNINSIIFAEFPRDIYLQPGDIFSNKKNIQIDNQARIYATIRNNSDEDISGYAIFFDKTENKQLSSKKIFSAISHKNDDVFVDFIPTIYGNHTIEVTISPNNLIGDNPKNNRLSTQVFVDYDTDKDGILNNQDPDMDNDKVPNNQDQFPLNYYEAYDTDRDGIGNNQDLDDDNDGLSDLEEKKLGTSPFKKDSDKDGINDKDDAFPLDINEQADFDQDGIGDNKDNDDDNDGILDEEDANPKSPEPKIILKFPETAPVNTSITFDASKSTVYNGKIAKIKWFFDDKIQQGQKIEHIFTETGIKKIYIKAYNQAGESSEKIIFITITPQWNYQILWIILIIILSFLLGQAMQAKLDEQK